MKLPDHRVGLPGHVSGEQNVSKGSFVHIVHLDPRLQGGACGARSGHSRRADYACFAATHTWQMAIPMLNLLITCGLTFLVFQEKCGKD